MRALSLLFMLFVVMPACPQEHKTERTADRKFWLVIGGLAASHTADMVSTRLVLDRGGYEQNTFDFGTYPSNRRLVGVSALYFGSETFAAYELKKLEHSPHRWMRIVGHFWWLDPVGEIGEHTRLTIHNVRILNLIGSANFEKAIGPIPCKAKRFASCARN